MKTVAMGCLLGLAGWLAAAGVISWLLQARGGHAFGDTLGVSAFAGLFACASVGLLYGSLTARRERSALRGGIAGVRPSDGSGAVIVGTLEPLGAPLQAPMDGTPCVTYSYAVNEDRGTGKQRTIHTHFKGVGLAPSTIVTASGAVKLLTVPDVEGGPATNTAGERIAAFERYARTTTFTRADTSAQELLDRWSDADGAYRSDVAYAALADVNLTNCQLLQQRVPPGARVCVFGTYSDAKGGIVPSTGLQAPPRLLVGDIDQVAAALASTARTRLGLGLLGAAATAGLIAAFTANG